MLITEHRESTVGVAVGAQQWNFPIAGGTPMLRWAMGIQHSALSLNFYCTVDDNWVKNWKFAAKYNKHRQVFSNFVCFDLIDVPQKKCEKNETGNTLFRILSWYLTRCSVTSYYMHECMSMSMYDHTFTLRPSNCDCTSDTEVNFLHIPLICDSGAGI